jgi:uncharacterized protein YdcH (DUF465 family)
VRLLNARTTPFERKARRAQREKNRMSHVAHELHEEFPDKADTIHRLKGGNAHFARLADEYHDVNRAIHRMEADVEPVADETLESMKKQRLTLKDEIAQLLATA